MTFIRQEARATLFRFREAFIGVVLVAGGGWIASSGGLFLLFIGVTVLIMGCAWTVLALRRLRFQQPGDAPGIVRVTEAQIAYMGPRVGGFVGLPDLIEVRLLTLRGRRIWRLRQADGAMLHIPVEADGADSLFDAFATLPGLDTATLVAALGTDVPTDSKVVALDGVDRLIWSRKGAAVVPR